ncbi:uncharacterized protein DSM5745_03595 [Aspergillus mulundensis]|uniref:Uncharacterized protein n=1 Tax=Aspergillus mulundensis TaxID=1810919 RepID=A0A3D8SKX0_9EURO|nr:hypothetical protein DSM5745_03595 [Aspergillus mulundensis]RDW86953.1 hypothetical protein DSM5745_03595 [Aspergillus mulundensis]
MRFNFLLMTTAVAAGIAAAAPVNGTAPGHSAIAAATPTPAIASNHTEGVDAHNFAKVEGNAAASAIAPGHSANVDIQDLGKLEGDAAAPGIASNHTDTVDGQDVGKVEGDSDAPGIAVNHTLKAALGLPVTIDVTMYTSTGREFTVPINLQHMCPWFSLGHHCRFWA